VFKLLGLTMVAVILIGSFAVTPSYGKTQTVREKFFTDFETSTIPACSTNEVFISGTLKFVFTATYGPDGELKQQESLSKYKTTGVDTEGNNWKVSEQEFQTIKVNPYGDQTFSTEIHSKFINLGPGDDPSTIVNIHLVTVVHPDGTAITLKDKADIDCRG
jgi:hypothetical protein